LGPRWVLVLAVSADILLSSSSAIAAEQVVLKYRIFRESISVEELTTLLKPANSQRRCDSILLWRDRTQGGSLPI